MTVAFVVVGLILGALLLEGGGGFLFGGLVGYLTAQVVKLRRRIREIEATPATSEVVADAAGPVSPVGA